jgi:hypothetical protein
MRTRSSNDHRGASTGRPATPPRPHTYAPVPSPARRPPAGAAGTARSRRTARERRHPKERTKASEETAMNPKTDHPTPGGLFVLDPGPRDPREGRAALSSTPGRGRAAEISVVRGRSARPGTSRDGAGRRPPRGSARCLGPIRRKYFCAGRWCGKTRPRRPGPPGRSPSLRRGRRSPHLSSQRRARVELPYPKFPRRSS